MKRTDKIVEVVPLVALPAQGNQKFSYTVPATISLRPGTLVKIPFANRVVDGLVWGKSKNNFFKLKTIIRVERSEFISTDDLKWLEDFSEHSFESLSLMTKSLVLNRKFSPEIIATKNISSKSKFSIQIKQEENDLMEAIANAPSGQVLILVPENVFTENVLNKCKTFGRPCYPYNNQQSQKEKNKVLAGVAKNLSCFIVATHAGIFLPLSNLVTIIVLEPALLSHRQWNIHPYYDARVGAYLKSKSKKIPLIYISTLPSFEIIFSMKNKSFIDFGKITLVNKGWDEPSFISRETVGLIRLNATQGKKVLIFHEATGYESLYVCRDCGNTLRCDRCNSILQRQAKNLFCKNCSLVVGQLQAFCNKCGSPKINALKTGTRAIEQVLHREFPQLNILRIDQETKKNDVGRDLISKADIIVATQKIFSAIGYDIFDYCIIPDFSSTLNAVNHNALEESLITLKRISNITKQSASKTIYIQNTGSATNILKYLNSNNILELINNDLKDRMDLLFPPFSIMMTCEKEFSSQSLAQKEINKLKIKIYSSFKNIKLNLQIYKRHSVFVGQIILRDHELIIREAMKQFPPSWSIDAPLSLSNLFQLPKN